MAWLTANWFWVLILIAFVAMHLFGHGGHGGHGGGDHLQRGGEKASREVQGRGANTGGHQH